MNTGCAAGNEAPTLTELLLPLTEIVAVVALALETGARAPLVMLAGAAPASGELLAEVVGGAVDAEAHDAGSGVVESEAHSVETCCLKGSLLLKSLNETSCPASGGSGLAGSRMPSADVAGAEVDAPVALPPATDPPASEGGARGCVPEAVVVLEGVLDAAV